MFFFAPPGRHQAVMVKKQALTAGGGERMAVNKVPTSSVLRLELNIGLDEGGNPVYRIKSLNNVKPAAADQDLFDVAAALAALQGYTLNGISRVDGANLVQV
jgi:hypothetical protein